MQNSECQFSNRMDKCRSVHKLKKSLPVDPAKREAVLKAYIEVSPAMKCVREKISTSYGDETAEKIIENLHTFIHKSKLKRNDDSRMTMNILSASVSGESVNDPKADRNIAKKLGLKPRRLFGGKTIRTQILKTDKSCFEITKRKTRNDALSEDVKKTIFDFWCSPSISRTTSNKKDIKRMRLGPKIYSSHQIQLLEKNLNRSLS